MNVIGPDNSHHQDHTLDYAKVAKTCRLAIHKANEFGADERFAERWKAMAAAGLVRGAYDFLLLFPTAPTGATQAAQYLGIVKAAGGFAPEDLQPIADIERGPADPPNRHPNQDATRASTIERINSWAAAIESADLEPTVYGRAMLKELHITAADCPKVKHVWAARYNNELGTPAVTGWPDSMLRAWQYTNGTANFTSMPKEIPGIGKGDVSVIVGKLSAWQQMGEEDELSEEDRKRLSALEAAMKRHDVFLNALTDKLGQKGAPDKPATPVGAGQRVAKATKKAE